MVLSADAEPFSPQKEKLEPWLEYVNCPTTDEEEDEIRATNEWVEDLADLGCLEMEQEMQMKSELLDSLHGKICNAEGRMRKTGWRMSGGRPYTWPRYVNVYRHPMASHS
eukprot:835363_1